MFISSEEKNNLWQAIKTLTNKVKELELEAVWIKSKTRNTKKTRGSGKLRNQLAKTKEAPWGLKKDGSPRNRPGRKPQLTEISL